MKTNMSAIREIIINPKEMNEYKERITNRALLESDYDLMLAMIERFEEMAESINQKNMTIKKLQDLFFGNSTESSANILNNDKNPTGKKEKIKAKGHGRNGAEQYTGAEKIIVEHSFLKKGDTCPECIIGKLYPLKKYAITLKLWSNAPVQANAYYRSRLRCNGCGLVFTAELPEKAGTKKYDETVAAILALLRYGSGFPLNRLEKLQNMCGIPLPASTQWDLVNEFGKEIEPVYLELIRQAAQGILIHNDDTTNRILSLKNKSNNEEKLNGKTKPRTGIFTTGFVSESEEHKIALFFTGNKHAGENMNDLLAERSGKLEKPIQMCDALSRNQAKDFAVILANCLTHARRNFVDVFNNFSEQCQFVIELLGRVYKNDEIARDKKMSKDERLNFHQEKSKLLMDKLKIWFELQFENKLAEPNSGLGKAISYMLRHWEKLTMFLKVAGVPLDNNICERALKYVILHRKNSLFYKTTRGAYIGDLFMSLIHTCNLMKINAFHYLTTLHINCSKALLNPKDWMPWNYDISKIICST